MFFSLDEKRKNTLIKDNRNKMKERLGHPEDVFVHSISEGTLVSMNRQARETLAELKSSILVHLLSSPVLHIYETGFRVNGKRQWLHVISTIHMRHGMRAIQNARRNLRMTSVFSLSTKERWCMMDGSHTFTLYHAHHPRELRALWELHEQGCAKDMMDLLLEMKEEVEQSVGCLDEERVRSFERMYEQILWHSVAY
jgi:transposase